MKVCGPQRPRRNSYKSMPSQPPQIAKATLQALPSGKPVPVQFNPATLVYTVENSVAAQSGSPKKKQYVAQFSGKLTMDLQFDTTDTGTDVRLLTNAIAIFMQATGNASAAAQTAAPPSADGGDSSTPAKAPPVLMFQWGSYQFQGIMDSFKETIDFFSNDGVALRSLVSIGLSRQDLVFEDNQHRQRRSDIARKQRAIGRNNGRRPQRRAPARRRQRARKPALHRRRFVAGQRWRATEPACGICY